MVEFKEIFLLKFTLTPRCIGSSLTNLHFVNRLGHLFDSTSTVGLWSTVAWLAS